MPGVSVTSTSKLLRRNYLLGHGVCKVSLFFSLLPVFMNDLLHLCFVNCLCSFLYLCLRMTRSRIIVYRVNVTSMPSLPWTISSIDKACIIIVAVLFITIES